MEYKMKSYKNLEHAESKRNQKNKARKTINRNKYVAHMNREAIEYIKSVAEKEQKKQLKKERNELCRISRKLKKTQSQNKPL